MLVSLVLEVSPTRECRLPPTAGHFVHALFLDLVRRDCPELSEALHADFQAKPFTVSPLMGPHERDGEMRLLRPNDAYWLRFTALASPISPILLEWERRSWPLLRLMGAELRVTRATTDARAHPWAGRIAYEALWRHHFCGPLPPSVVDLEFFSPTTFKSAGLNVPLPLPRLLFHSWLERWKEYAPVDLGEEVEAALEARVALAGHRVRTSMAQFGAARSVGFVGQVRLQAVKSADEALVRTLNLLADFAFFAGTGQRTPMGLGMTRRASGK